MKNTISLDLVEPEPKQHQPNKRQPRRLSTLGKRQTAAAQTLAHDENDTTSAKSPKDNNDTVIDEPSTPLRRRPPRPKRKVAAKSNNLTIPSTVSTSQRGRAKKRKAVATPTTESESTKLPFSKLSKLSSYKHIVPYTINNSIVFVKSPVDVTSTFLELLLYRQSLINNYFDLAESILLTNKKSLVLNIDERYFTWITAGKYPPYTEFYSPEERHARQEVLKRFSEEKRERHQSAMTHLLKVGHLKNDEFLGELIPPTLLSAKKITNGLDEKFSPADQFQHKVNAPISSSLLTTDEEKRETRVNSWIMDWIKKDKEIHNRKTLAALSTDFDEISLTALSHIKFLKSPIVHVSCLASWSPREFILFELGLCTFGQDFTRISSIVETKNYKECYSFYAEIFKQSTRYKLFKEYKKLASWYGV